MKDFILSSIIAVSVLFPLQAQGAVKKTPKNVVPEHRFEYRFNDHLKQADDSTARQENRFQGAKSSHLASRAVALRSVRSVAGWSCLPGANEEIRYVELLTKNFHAAFSTLKWSGAHSSEATVAKRPYGATWMYLATHGLLAESSGWG